MAAIPALPTLFQPSPSRGEFQLSADNGKLVSEICKALIGVDCRDHDAYGMPTQATFEAEDLTWAIYLEFCFGSECINHATNLEVTPQFILGAASQRPSKRRQMDCSSKWSGRIDGNGIGAKKGLVIHAPRGDLHSDAFCSWEVSCRSDEPEMAE